MRVPTAARRVWTAGRKPLLWVVGALAAVIIWAVGIEPRLLDEREEVAFVPGLPAAWEGARIALFADLQVGMWLANTDTIDRAARRIAEASPAAALIAGDFLYEPTEEAGEPREARDELGAQDLRELAAQASEAIARLRPMLKAGVPTFAVLGNHDYAMQWPDSLPLPEAAGRLAADLQAAGITVLRNRAVPLGRRDAGLPDGERLYLGGLDAWFPNATDPRRMLADIPKDAPRLVLMHNPSSFRQLPPGTAPIALAAHTHGGQVRIPFLPNWSWVSLAKNHSLPADGWAPPGFGAPGNRLYVNRGIGFSLAPVRINCRPELTWLTLHRAAASVP